MALYNLKSADGQWRITKFTNDLEVESSYLTSETECECPAGVRPTCRHRQMLPKMLNVGAEDSGMFYDFDHDQFLEPLSDAEDTQSVIVSPLEDSSERSDTELESSLPSFQQIHDGVITPEMEREIEARSALSPPATFPLTQQSETTIEYPIGQATVHPAITGTLKRRI